MQGKNYINIILLTCVEQDVLWHLCIWSVLKNDGLGLYAHIHFLLDWLAIYSTAC